MSVITVRILAAPAVNKREILRYAGIARGVCDFDELIDSCLAEALPVLEYKVCFCELECKIADNICDFGLFSVSSRDLAKNLAEVRSAILFGATVGVGLDRLITKRSSLSPARALMLQAIGAERIEALCDAFCKDLEQERGVLLRPRFSAGYGDLALDEQKKIFEALKPQKSIGLFLNSSLSMSPSKSVTAFAGIK